MPTYSVLAVLKVLVMSMYIGGSIYISLDYYIA